MKELKGTSFEVLLISKNTLLKEAVSSIEKVTLVLMKDQVDPTLSFKVILLDGEHVSYRDIKFAREQCPSIPIFYKVHNVSSHSLMKNILAVCTAYNIHTIEEQRTNEQVATEMKKILFEEEYAEGKRLISFSGTHSGSGVSTLTLNVAKALSEKVKEKVLVLSLNPWDPADYFVNYNGKYLDAIKVELNTKNLNEQTLLDAVSQVDNFYMLAGNRDVKLQRYYTVDEINHLIDIAKQTFDVVLIDAGSHFDNACYAQSYIESEMKFLVTTQEPKGYRGYWPHIFHQLIQPSGGKAEDYMLLINKYESELSLISEKDLSEELDMFLLTTIPDEGTLSSQAIAQKKLLFDIGTKDYRRSISTIANSVIARAKLTINESSNINEENRKGFLSILFQRKEA